MDSGRQVRTPGVGWDVGSLVRAAATGPQGPGLRNRLLHWLLRRFLHPPPELLSLWLRGNKVRLVVRRGRLRGGMLLLLPRSLFAAPSSGLRACTFGYLPASSCPAVGLLGGGRG